VRQQTFPILKRQRLEQAIFRLRRNCLA